VATVPDVPAPQPTDPFAPIGLQKDLTNNENEFERGFQAGWNQAIEIINAELARRWSMLKR
jgi:hypothetical protein